MRGVRNYSTHLRGHFLAETQDPTLLLLLLAPHLPTSGVSPSLSQSHRTAELEEISGPSGLTRVLRQDEQGPRK